MRKKYLFILLISLVFYSCENKIVKFSKDSTSPVFANGEWLESSDTLNGISVRKNKIAFFKNMEFKSDEIKQYFIIDSVYKDGEIETQKGEYLLLVNNILDTLKYKILKRDNKIILLDDLKGTQKQYNFWR